MNKNKRRISYYILTVVLLLLFAVYINLSSRWGKLAGTSYGPTNFILLTAVIFPVLWAILIALRSFCYRNSFSSGSGLIPEIVFFLLGLALCLFAIWWWVLPGRWWPSNNAHVLLLRREVWIFYGLFAGDCLYNILAGAVRLKRKRKVLIKKSYETEKGQE